ncbi:hypothetical protein BDV37DRAFT_237539 [Aspergillus pseudonomiae]|uniref:Secreted protein n=1 Tax=Aspergillus pseudonomiae TaxID=1506151 RepID=A0A5N7DRK3_9EURO|nr:uncharacterized protein BDV37DRAFT_237539 [Aspergillus pseudonomiae]KAE8408915.1 hypothetical protein BDV37DRAFT_237539 [Aspergillus pseudonomiae]
MAKVTWITSRLLRVSAWIRALRAAARARRCMVFPPRCASQQEKGPGTVPIAFWLNDKALHTSGLPISPPSLSSSKTGECHHVY